MEKIELLVECSICRTKRKKPYLWLREKHLPCPNCGNEFVISNSHIATVEMKMQDALKEMDDIFGTKVITLTL